jgi:conjugative relaxase-like TrwC/TraI family protein
LAQVLRLAKLPLGGHAYYLEVAAGTGSGIEAAGRWVGSGPAVLGLAGAVDTGSLAAVLAGCDPATGEPLGGARGRVTVAAFDLTFAAPKSVSLLHALGDAEIGRAVGAGHHAAVEAALGYVERRALGVRRGSGSTRTTERASGTATAAFVHRTSRADDPHLHTHLVTANLARGPDDRWGAVDGRGLYAHAAAVGALYHAHLRYELRTRLGVAWGPLDRGRADIEGIGPEARRAFSTRRTQITAELAGYGHDSPSARARHVAWASTRAERDAERPVEALVPVWRERARAVGLGPRMLDAVVDRLPRRAAELPDPEVLGSAVAAQLAGRPSLTRRDVVRASCARLAAGAPSERVEVEADRVLEGLGRSVEGGGRDGPGVTERRVPTPALATTELDRLLARRGVRRDAGIDRQGPGLEGGFGLG